VRIHPPHRLNRWCLCAGLLAAALMVPRTIDAANEPRPAPRSERKTFTDAEIIDGFFKVTFGAELHVASNVDRIRKYDGPIRVFIDDRGYPNRRAQMTSVVEDIRAHIKEINLSIAEDRSAANVVVALVRDRDLNAAIRTAYGVHARRIQQSLRPQCLSSLNPSETSAILNSHVILVVDVSDFVFLDCAYEELLQALGPINDDSSVPWTMFNDDVSMGYFGIYDQYLLNILYHPRIRPGMTREDVRRVLPEILPEVREFVAKTNGFPPNAQ
jgi:hypothetical protein